MKNRSLPIALLILVLVIGLVGGIFLMLPEDTEPDLGISRPTSADTEDDLVIDSANQDTAPAKPANAQPPKADDPKATASNDPPNTEPETPAKQKPEHSIWAVTEYEIKVHGTVRLASDNTPIVCNFVKRRLCHRVDS